MALMQTWLFQVELLQYCNIMHILKILSEIFFVVVVFLWWLAFF